MNPDFQRAATLAAETLIKYKIDSAPVSPLHILKKIPNVLVVSYEELSHEMGMDRKCVMDPFGEKNQDAFTSVNIVNGKPQYLVTYNQKLSVNLAQRGLARELGHILLQHDGTKPEKVRNDEARCFAHHLLCPRAMIYNIKATGIRLTTEVLGNLTGCYDLCLTCMRRQPAVHIDPELNRQVRDLFMPYIMNFFEFQKYARHKDGSALADFGNYMEGYEE